MTTTKVNGKGTQGVNPAKNENVNGNSNPVTPVKTEEKTTTVITETKPKTLDEQINFFLGLEKTVNKARHYQTHLKEIEKLEFTQEELTEFKSPNSYGARIELYDNDRHNYTVSNPILVLEMKNHLLQLLQNKIDACNNEILSYSA